MSNIETEKFQVFNVDHRYGSKVKIRSLAKSSSSSKVGTAGLDFSVWLRGFEKDPLTETMHRLVTVPRLVSSSTPVLMMGRYKAARQSSFCCVSSLDPGDTLSRLNYHSVRKAALAPLNNSAPATTRSDSDGAVDDGVPKFLYSLEPRHLAFHRDLVLPALPQITAQVNAGSYDLLGQAFDICTIMPEWADPDCDKDAKAKKGKLLADISKSFQDASFVQAIPDPIADKFFAVLETNVFRAIPLTPPKYLFGNIEPVVVDVAWPHLSLVYDLLSAFLSGRPQDARFTLLFERRLLRLLSVPDCRERGFLADLLSKYTNVFPDREKGLWTQMAFMLNCYRQNDEVPYIVTPILSFFAQRFKDPCCDKDLRAIIFNTAITPLLSSQHFVSFTDKIREVVGVITENDQPFLVAFIKIVVARFPESDSTKQVAYIAFLNGIMEGIGEREFPQIIHPVFELYARLSENIVFKVVEAAVKVWSNVKILPKILDNTRAVFLVMHPSLIKTMNEHWRPATQALALSTLRTMQELDPGMFDQLKLAPKKKGAPPAPVDNPLGTKSRIWSTIARLAARADRSLVLQTLLARITQIYGVPT
jgi:hypothetical protein